MRAKTPLVSNCATSARIGEQWMDWASADASGLTCLGKWFMIRERRRRPFRAATNAATLLPLGGLPPGSDRCYGLPRLPPKMTRHGTMRL